MLPLAEAGVPFAGNRWRARVDVHVGNARSLHFEEEAICYFLEQPLPHL